MKIVRDIQLFICDNRNNIYFNFLNEKIIHKMLICNRIVHIFYILLTCITNIICSKSWDLAVTIGREVHFYSYNGTLTERIKNPYPVVLSGIAYDELSHLIFIGESNNTAISIFSKNIQSEDTEMDILLDNSSESWNIVNMIYDPVSQSLVWTDGKKKGIYKLNVSSLTKNMKPEIILNLTNESPQGITFDLCNRRLFWTNNHQLTPSISSANFDGSNYSIVVNNNLYDPLALTYDHTTKKLYWIDDDEGIHYKIERSNPDGSSRELLVRGTHQKPFDITIDEHRIYWTDWVYGAIWTINKDIKRGDTPKIWKSFRKSYKDPEPTTVMTQYTVGVSNCISFEIQDTSTSVLTDSNREQYNVFTNTADSIELVTENQQICLNGGYFNAVTHGCECQHGFSGDLCEESVCYNYCIHGKCHILPNGDPHCECDDKYQGLRCDRDICSNYCVNDGECTLINGEPHCTCKYSQGLRCEEVINATEVCTKLCDNSSDVKSIIMDICHCSVMNGSSKSISSFSRTLESKTLTIVLLTTIGVLIVIIIVLGYILHMARRRPRVKRRFVVSKNGITPLTSRPSLSNNECEIIIENCCNMNICETPCFDPTLRNTNTKTSRRSEKSSLLEGVDNNINC